MQYISGYVCYFLYLFHKEISFCSGTIWHYWKPVEKLFFSFNAIGEHHNDHIQNCRENSIVLYYSTRTITLCTIHTVIHELDKKTIDVDFSVETRKIEKENTSNVRFCVNAVMSVVLQMFKEIDWFVESWKSLFLQNIVYFLLEKSNFKN